MTLSQPELKKSNQDIIAAKKLTITGLILNILLTALKLIAGYLGKSSAMIADAIHTFSDIFTDIVTFIGLIFTDSPQDEKHPYGHGRIETFFALILGLTLIAAAGGIALKALLEIVNGEYLRPKVEVLFIAALSIIIKEILFRYTDKLATKLHCKILKANAWHHRSDAFSSFAIFLGIGGAIINPAWQILDPLAACVVAIFIFKVAGEIIFSAISELVDTAANKEICEKILSIAQEVAGVTGAHELKTRHVGSLIYADLHIEVPPRLSVTEGHDIATLVKRRIENGIYNVNWVNIHLEPEGDYENHTNDKKVITTTVLEAKIETLIKEEAEILGMHGLKINNAVCQNILVKLDIEVDSKLSVEKGHKIAKNLRRKILQEEGVLEVIIHVDPYYKENSLH